VHYYYLAISVHLLLNTNHSFSACFNHY